MVSTKIQKTLHLKIWNRLINVASITVNGSYEQMTAVNEAAAKWIETEGYKLAGQMFNIYHVSPAMESDPNKWVTEVCYPINK